MVQVKICGITNLADALASVEAGADALGFNFSRASARFIAPEEARRIIEQLPAGVLTVGVFVNEGEPEGVARTLRTAGVAVAQLHGDETAEYCRALVRQEGYRVIKALRVGPGFSPGDATAYETEAILLDAYTPEARGGTGQKLDWSLARQTRELVEKLFLAGGLTPETVAEAINTVRPYGVDVCSGVERSPGLKDAARLRAFLAAVRAAAPDT
jgi:phosphoribosylanthranilate isomerase